MIKAQDEVEERPCWWLYRDDENFSTESGPIKEIAVHSSPPSGAVRSLHVLTFDTVCALPLTTMSKQFQFKLVLLGALFSFATTISTLTSMQASLQLESLGLLHVIHLIIELHSYFITLQSRSPLREGSIR